MMGEKIMATILYNKEGDPVVVKNARKVGAMIASGDFTVEPVAQETEEQALARVAKEYAKVVLKELKAKAKESGIKGYGKMNAEQITEALAAND
jgi:hypothetical protein